MNIDQLLNLPVWEHTYVGNTVGEYAVSFLVFLAGLVILGVFKSIVLNKLEKIAKKSSTDIDDILIAVVNEIHPPFYSFIAFYIAIKLINVIPIIDKVITAMLLLWVTYQITAMVRVFIDRAVKRKLGEDDGSAHAAVQIISAIFTAILWVLGVLLVLQNLGINVTSLIAGLGIGGLAVALALQSVLSDLFGSFSILFDKPFTVGDFIVAGNVSGTVEKIGIKTTRLRATSGEQVVVSNTELTGAVIQNYKRMEERRMVFSFGVTYETDPELLKQIPEIVKKVVEKEGGTRFMSTHFKEFGDSAYVYETIYYVSSPDYYEYLKMHDLISVSLIEAFAQKHIDMAYPTQRVYMSKVED